MKISIDANGNIIEQNQEVVASMEAQKGKRSERELLEEFSSILDKIAVQLSDQGVDFAGMYNTEITVKIREVKNPEKPEKKEKQTEEKAEEKEVKLASALESTQNEEEAEEVVVEEEVLESKEVEQSDQEEVVEAEEVEEVEEVEVKEIEEEEEQEQEVRLGLEEDSIVELEIDEEVAQLEEEVVQTTEDVEQPNLEVVEPAELVSEVKEQVEVEKDVVEEKVPEQVLQENPANVEKEASDHQGEVKAEVAPDLPEQAAVEEKAPQAWERIVEISNREHPGEQKEEVAEFLRALKERISENKDNLQTDQRAASQLVEEIKTEFVDKIMVKAPDRALIPLFLKQLGLETVKVAGEAKGAFAGPRSVNPVSAHQGVKDNSNMPMGQGQGLTKSKTLPRQQAARTLERVQEALKAVAKSKDGKTLSLRLDPPSLGTVKIDVTLKDGTLHARLVAEVPQVNNLLREKGHELQFVLRRLGLNVDQISVSVGSGKRQMENETSFSGNKGRVQQKWGLGEGNEQEEIVGAGAIGNQVGEDPVDHWIA